MIAMTDTSGKSMISARERLKRRRQREARSDQSEGAMMDEDDPMLAWAKVRAGEICLTDEASELLNRFGPRIGAGDKLTAAEMSMIDAALRECPGYCKWEARQMLARTLRGEKAFA